MSLPAKITSVLAAVIVAAGVLATGTYFVLRASIQPRSGTLTLAGLTAPVDVSWDEWAIPTIVGVTESDVLRAQGFIHASERLWQLELFQRIARGRLSGIFGEATLDTDRLIRTLDLWGAAGRALEDLSPRARELLEAYAEGVNERISTWRGPLPPEFILLGIRPGEWSPRASLAIAVVMSLDLAGWQTELDRLGTLARIPAGLRPALEPGYPDWGPTILQDSPGPARPLGSDASADTPGLAVHDAPRGRGRVGAERRLASAGRPAAGRFDMILGLGLNASNSWAVGGSRTADGHPLLANDMHLSLRAPSTWFVNGLHAGADGLHVAGLSIPGAPGVVVGLNRSLAWGFTNAMVDDGDFVVESVSLDGTLYRAGEEWTPFETRTERIAVRGRADEVEHVVRETARGPVITDVLPAAGLTASLLWTGFARTGSADALLAMNRASSAEEFRAALVRFGTPHQNVIYATTGGELGYRLVGSVPRRGGLDGSRAIPFRDLPDGWTGFRPPDSMPALRAPASDYLSSANNLQSRSLFGIVGWYYPLPWRARRIDDVVSAASGWTYEDMVALQLDTRSLWADRLVPRAAASAHRIGRPEVADALERWNRRVDLDSREAVRFYAWLYGLRQRIASDELEGDGWFPDLALQRVLDGDESWVDDVRTAERETLEGLEEEAMRAALEVSGESTWGESHVERSVHPLGRVAWLGRLFRFDVGPYPAPGGRHTVRPDEPFRWSALDSTSWTPPFVSEYGPSERFVAHLDPDGPVGRFFLPTGQAGNPFDRHYRDMSGWWVSGDMALVSLDPDEQRARRASELRLEPADEGAGNP